MPKQKTHSGAKKRFKVTAAGKLLRRHADEEPHAGEEVARSGSGASGRTTPRRAQRRQDRQEAAGDRVSDASRQAIRPRAQEAAQGPRAGQGLLGPQDQDLHATRRSRSSTRSSTPTATARRRSGRSGSLWIIRINAAARQHGLSYNQFVAGCSKAEIELDRKVLADLAVSDPAAFGAIAEQAKAALERPEAAPVVREALITSAANPAAQARPQARVPAPAGQARAVRLRGRGSRRGGPRAGIEPVDLLVAGEDVEPSCSPGSRRWRTRRA